MPTSLPTLSPKNFGVMVTETARAGRRCGCGRLSRLWVTYIWQTLPPFLESYPRKLFERKFEETCAKRRLSSVIHALVSPKTQVGSHIRVTWRATRSHARASRSHFHRRPLGALACCRKTVRRKIKMRRTSEHECPDQDLSSPTCHKSRLTCSLKPYSLNVTIPPLYQRASIGPHT